MRTLALAAAISVLTPRFAHADASSPGHRKKVAGLVLIGVGSAIAIVGQALLIDAAANPRHMNFDCPPGPCAEPTYLNPIDVWFGAPLTAVGDALILSGIPVYVVGGVEDRRATVASAAEVRF